MSNARRCCDWEPPSTVWRALSPAVRGQRWGGVVVAQLGAGELHLQEAVGGLRLDERSRLGVLQPRAGQGAGPVSLKRLLDESPWLRLTSGCRRC
eukprot:COSAG01_NODE_532_length_15843_cov_58.969258_4_plen_95_part_00